MSLVVSDKAREAVEEIERIILEPQPALLEKAFLSYSRDIVISPPQEDE